MNSQIKKTTVPFGALVGLVLFLIAAIFFSVSTNVLAQNKDAAANGRLVTIYDRGTKKTVLTQAATIGDALKEAGVLIDANDAVEPSVDITMVSTNYQVNIYRARPVMIIDGNVRQRIMTPYQTAEQIAKAAEITLYPEDKAEISLAENLIDGAGLQLTIQRATTINLTLYGKTAVVRTQAKTVGDMLKEKNIKLGNSDRMSVGANDQISDGMSMRIWREGKQTITVDETIDFKTETIDNADQPVGYREIQSVGEAGSRTVIYEVVIQDNIEISRTEITSVITKQPVKQVEIVGVKGKYNTPSENETIIWNFLRAQGFSRIQTAGIMGNLQQEHQFNTTDVTGGLGIAQWTLDRRTDLINKYPDSYTNIYSQLSFLMEELNGTYYRARDAIMATDNLDTAVVAFQEKFEGCGVCKESQRKEYARTILGSHQ
jgi:uncharacterized protein YabE (DUF348 family)